MLKWKSSTAANHCFSVSRLNCDDSGQYAVNRIFGRRNYLGLADLFAKHAFLLNGLGWGGMPRHTVEAVLQAGRLVELAIEDVPAGGLALTMQAVYRAADPPGPAGRWMIERLKGCRERQD